MKRILIVDDEEKLRKVYLSLLRTEGFDAIEAASAYEAHETLKRESIDLILLDIKMPEIDGSVLSHLIQTFHKKTKVIVVSVYPVDEQKRIILDADDYYDKSQRTDILLAKVKKILERVPVHRN